MSKQKSPKNTLVPPVIVDLPAAFVSVRAEIDAVPDTALVRMSIDVPYATTTAMGAAERIELLIPDLAELPGYDLAPVRAMPTYAAAALHTYLVGLEPVPRSTPLPALLKEAGRLRGDLFVLADALARLGLFSAAHVAAIRGGRSHADMANALCALATLYEQHWSEIGSHVPISRETIALAASIGMQLQLALGKRRLASMPRVSRDARRSTRARAFTLFFRAYDHCRRGVTFLRWPHGDVEHFAPSLYPKRKRRPEPLFGLPDAEPEASEAGQAIGGRASQ